MTIMNKYYIRELGMKHIRMSLIPQEKVIYKRIARSRTKAKWKSELDNLLNEYEEQYQRAA